MQNDTSSEIAVILAVQHARWKAGERPPVEAFFDGHPWVRGDRDARLDLIYQEVILRQESGEGANLGEYLARFPDLAAELRVQFELDAWMQPPSAGATLSRIDADTAFTLKPPPQGPSVAGYEILGVLGRGGMGVVYRAVHVGLNRTVALKMILHPGLVEGPARLRFRAEAEAVAAMQHPGIVQLFEAGEHEGLPFLTLEYCPGGTLAERIRDTTLSPTDAATLMRSVALAAHYAHERGVVHRDLKPENVLFADGDSPKISDFGLAKRLDDESDGLTRTGAIMGTPAFMAPEQVEHAKDAGAAADIWALGAILYRVLTGRTPFTGATPAAILNQLLHAEPPSPRQLDRAIPRDLATICMKCLQKNPAERYATAAILADDLARYLNGRTILARPTPAPERAWRWCRRNPGWAAMLGSAAFLMTLIAVGASFAALWLNQGLVRATTAEADTRRELWRSKLNEAAGIRRGNQRGHRFAALAKLREAVDEARSLGEVPAADLQRFRDEVTSALLVPDLEVVRDWPFPVGESTAIEFDGTLKTYALTDKDGTVTVHDSGTDAVRCRLPPVGPLTFIGLRLSPTGRWLIQNTGAGGEAKLWEIDGTNARFVQAFPDAETSAFAPDERSFAVGAKGQTDVYSLPRCERIGGVAGKCLVIGEPLHPTLTLACVYDALGVHVADTRTGEVRHTFAGHKSGWVCWNRAGDSLATVNPVDRSLHVLDWPSRVAIGTPIRTRDGTYMAFDPAGRVLLITDWSGVMNAIDVASGKSLFEYPVGVNLMRFAAGSNELAAETSEERLRVLRFWPGDDWRPLCTSGDHADRTRTSGVSPDGRWFTTFGPDGMRLIDPRAGTESARFPAWTAPLWFAAEGDRMETFGGGGRQSWPIRRRDGVARIGPPETLDPTSLWDIWGASADGLTVTAPRARNPVALAHGDSPGGQSLIVHGKDVRSTAVSPDGRWALIGCHGGGGVRVADTRTGRLVEPPLVPTEGGWGAFSADGRWVAASRWTESAVLFRVGTWEKVAELPGGHFAFTADGNAIAVGDNRGGIHFIECETGREFARLESPGGEVVQPNGFTPDGGVMIATAPRKGVVYRCDIRSIRRQLKQWGLDWEWPELPPEPPAAPVERVEFVSDPGANELFRQAMGQGKAGRVARAVALFREAVKANPDHALAGAALSIELTEHPKLANAPDEALTVARRAIEGRPTSSFARIALGMALFARGENREAARELTVGIRYNGGRTRAVIWYTLCRARLLSGDFGGAYLAVRPWWRGWIEQNQESIGIVFAMLKPPRE